MSIRKKNKIIITGASSGIGLEFGNQFQKKGWEIINISRSASKFKNYEVNLSNIDCVNHFMDIVEYEKPNMVIFNAGILYNKWLGEYTKDEILKTTNLNCTIPTLILNKLINSKIKLVFISSIAAYITPGSQAIYGASKSYLSQIVKAAQVEQLYKNDETNIVEIVFGKFLATNINPNIKNNNKINKRILENEIKKAIQKLLSGDITIWSHNNFYIPIAAKFHNNPINEGLKSIKYRLMKKNI